jgi:hypothetical protein
MPDKSPVDIPKEVEVGLKRSDVIWVGTGDRGAPSWFAYENSSIYVVSQREPGAAEQTVPGLNGSTEDLLVVTRRKGRETALDRFHAKVRVIPPGPEWEEAAKLLVDRRRSRAGSPAETIERWRDTCLIAELTPVLPKGTG